MPVAAPNFVSTEVVGHFSKLQILRRRPARTGNAGFAVCNQCCPCGNRIGSAHGLQRKQHACYVATGVRNQARFPQRSACMLGESIHRLTQQRRRRMRITVPFLVNRRITQAKVRAQINNAHATLQQAHGSPRSRAVRQAQKRNIKPGEICVGSSNQSDRRRLWMHFCQRSPGIAFGRGKRNVHVRMPRQQLHELMPRISSGPKYSNVNHNCKLKQKPPVSAWRFHVYSAVLPLLPQRKKPDRCLGGTSATQNK